MVEMWLRLTSADLRIEQGQDKDEGRDIAPLSARCDELCAALDAPDGTEDFALQQAAYEWIDACADLPLLPGYKFVEPSSPAEIRAERPAPVALGSVPQGEEFFDRVHGAWTGRCCGCMLGKPCEGVRRRDIELALKAQGRWPIADYWSGLDADAVKAAIGHDFWLNADSPHAVEHLDRMPEDDDTNYTVTGMEIVRLNGRDFTARDVGNFWCGNIPLLHVCTAERMAYRNYTLCVPTVDNAGRAPTRFTTATYRNPYREWIGAQIRADFFGYCNPGNPEAAADFGWRDASFSHVRNGVYGEMWAAAMIAAAFATDSVETAIRAGMAQIPARSRLFADLAQVFEWRRQGLDSTQALDAIHARWNEAFGHHWCHTNSNAQIVAWALLWGEKDFTRTIGLAVSAGFDTDCNGATAGSVLGAMLGRKALPEHLTAPLHDRLVTGIAGRNLVNLSDMARETIAISVRA